MQDRLISEEIEQAGVEAHSAPLFLDKIMGVVPSIIYVFNQRTQSNEFTNRSIGGSLGYSGDEIREMGDNLFPSLCHPDDLHGVFAHFGAIQAMQDGEISTIEYRMRNKAGKWVWLLSYDTVLDRDDAGAVLRHIGIATDITPQKQAEEMAQNALETATRASAEQKATSELLTQIMNTAKSGIVGLSARGEVVWINATGRHILGGVLDPLPFAWPAEISFVDNETLQPVPKDKDPLCLALAGHGFDGEIFNLARAGSREARYVRVSSAPLGGAESHVASVMILDDVSEQEMHRQQVERTSRLDALGQLTGGMAHDFNNLLATVSYALELIDATEDRNKRQDYLATAKSSVARGAELTKRLLAFAKQQPGLASAQLVSGVLDEFRLLSRPLIEESLDLTFAYTEADLRVFCDLGQLSNALLNLVLNARDAILQSGKGKRIMVSARGVSELDADVTLRREHPHTYIAKGVRGEHSEDQNRADDKAYRYVEISVTDDGPGMPNAVKQRAVDPFFTTKDHGSGTGLGLSMVYGFVQQSAGELRIYSEPDQGTTVRLILPRGTADGIREEPEARAALHQGQGQRILLVEDEASLLTMMVELVTTLGYHVGTACNGHDALDQLERDHYDLVITDIVMPEGMSGFELAREIRTRKPTLPMIYMSGYTGYSQESLGDLKAPLLQKPCPPTELANAIREALRRDATNSADH